MGMKDPYAECADIPIGEETDEGWQNKKVLIPGRVDELPGLPAHAGLTVMRLPKTGFVVAEVHYSVEHVRRKPGWAKASSRRYGRRGFRSYKWRQEMEIDFEASSGDPVYANWDSRVHVVKPFEVPRTWPKWIMYDPGGVNPHAVEWWTLDPTPPDYTLYCYRQWYKGLAMPNKTEGQYHLANDVIRITYELSMDHLGNPERIDALIIDPAARITKATAAGSDRGQPGQPTARGQTMYEEIVEVCEQLGWNIDVVTGNNLKDASIDEVIERLGNFPLYEEEEGEPILNERGEPILQRDQDGHEVWVQPRLFVFTSCKWLGWEFGHYKWAQFRSEVTAEERNRPEAPSDKDDHSMTNVIRLMNWIRRDDRIYGGGYDPGPTDHAASLVADWRKRRREITNGE